MNFYPKMRDADVVFWDFDGVIKDSIDAKSKAFEELFSDYGENLVNRIRLHHQKNSGVSRYQKIPLYLSWVDANVTDERIEEYVAKFSKAVKQSVISSPWVPGVWGYIKANFKRQVYVIVTATPQDEIEEILDRLQLRLFFHEVYGSPIDKSNVIRDFLISHDYCPEKTLVVGDSKTDFIAAKNNSVPFLLRPHKYNRDLQFECRVLDADELNYGQTK